MLVGDPQLWRLLERRNQLVSGRGSRLEKASAMLAAMAHLAPFYGNGRSMQTPAKSTAGSLQRPKAFLSENLDRKILLNTVQCGAAVGVIVGVAISQRSMGQE